MNDAAKRVLSELTGLTDVYMEQVGTFGEIERDPGERVVSVAYYALLNINESDRELVQKHNAFWVNINELPELIFDHPQMVEQARELMRMKASTEPIGSICCLSCLPYRSCKACMKPSMVKTSTSATSANG